MKNTFLLFLLVSTINFSIANDTDCDEENNLASIAKGFAYPNCNIPKSIDELKIKNTNLLCNTCKKEFELIHGKKISENKNHLQEEFFHSSLNEYKKNVTNNLYNTLKMKSVYGKGFNFSKSISACKMREAKDFAKNCKSSARNLLAKTNFFKSLSIELSNDIAKFISTDSNYSPKPTLLQRTKQSCHIPETDVQLYSAATYEEAFNKEIIEYIQKIDPKKYSSIDELFSSDDFIENFGDSSDLKVSLRNHPLISGHLSTVETFVNFTRKVPKPTSTEQLRSTLYNPSNASKFDETLAESCDKSFKELEKAICSDEFEEGKLYNDPLNNFAKLKVAESLPSESQFASTEALVDNNIKLLELCESKKENTDKNLSEVNSNIGVSLTEEQKSQSYNYYTSTKYNSELGSLTSSLCEMTDRTCIQGTITCSIYQKYKAFKYPKTKLSKPIDFASNQTDELLRAMIGDTTKINPETKNILIAHGILPKEDGKFIEKPQIPESQEQFFSKMPSQQINPGPAKTKPTKGTNLASSQQARTQPSTDNFSNNSIANNNSSTAPTGDMSDISDLVRGSTEDLKDIQNEIKRRLGDLPQNKPATLANAKKIARDTFKNKGRKITPYQEQALAERMLQPEVPNSVSQNTSDVTPNKASVSDTDTQLEKWKKGQKDAALMGMQGAQKVLANDAGRAPASVEAKPKDLTTVALNIAEDPKVKLSDIFASKIDQNDPETQLLKVLLKNKNNFLLQVKDMNFKIVFDEKNNFNVLLESGDRAEAERMRPQLEIFLKRLKS